MIVATNGRVADVSGLRFGRLLALEPLGKIKGAVSWYCVCDCGMYCFVSGTELRAGRRGSCGLHGCELVELVDDVPSPSKWLRRDVNTLDLVDALCPMPPTRARPAARKPDHRLGNLNKDIIANRNKLIEAVSVGDVVRFSSRNPSSSKLYAFGIVLSIRDDCFLLRTERGVRRVKKQMVRFDLMGAAGNEAIRMPNW